MNKSNGGKQRKQHDTVIPESNPDPTFRGKVQRMVTESGEAKGLQQVLEERGFDVHGMRAKCKPTCPWENERCCMARLLSKQEDFANQPSMLETLIKSRGHECIFLPKFHCELNPIEMVSSISLIVFSHLYLTTNAPKLQYWGWCKYRYREMPKKTFDDAKRAAYECLDACPINVIRRFVNRSWRFMDAYRKGLTGKAAAWAVKKQKGHRTCSHQAMMAIDAVLN
jgi:hypothetical protein